MLMNFTMVIKCVDNDYTYKIITEKDYNFYAR